MHKFTIVVCLILLAALAFAQSDRGSITGAVADPSGAVVASAKIEAKNVDNGTVYEAGSSTTGNYVLPQLPTGNYELTVTVTGFKKYVKQNIFLPVAQTVRVDIKLEVGTTSDTVTITEATPLLKTESGELSHNVTSDRINNLPVLQIGTGAGLRTPYAMTNLIPGSSYNPDVAIRINGMPSNTQSIRLEGQDAQMGIWSGTQSWTQPSVDAIQETSIQTSNYAAEFGQAGGGVFNTTMKSGTNQYHGSAYDYLANEALNAGTPNTAKPADPSQHIRNRLRRTDYGFSVGGPVWIPKIFDGHDKTFFFFNFEQFREDQVTFAGTANGIKTVPTLAYRQGDFSAALGTTPIGTNLLGNQLFNNQVFDPCSTQPGTRLRTAFPGNKVPLGAASCLGGTYLDPVTAKFQSLMPLPNNTLNATGYQDYWVSYASPKRQTVPSIKLDHSLSSKAKLSGYWGRTTSSNPNADGMPFPITSSNGLLVTSYTTRINFDYTLTPTLLLHLGAGLLTADDPEQGPGAPLGTAYDTLGFFGLKGTGTTQVLPTVGAPAPGFSGGPATGPIGQGGLYGGYVPRIGPSTNIDIHEYKPTANTSLTWVKSNHTYKFGAEFNTDGYLNHSNTYAAPWIGFSNLGTIDGATNASTIYTPGTSPGFIYASFLMGLADDGYTSVPANTRLGKKALGLFAQDTWKVTRKLTLDYGLRWDFQTYLREHNGYQGSVSLSTPNPIAPGHMGATIFEGYGGGRCNCDFAHNYPLAFGPRIGVAYQITPKTVLRVGAGISYTRTSANNFQSYAVASNTPYSPSQYGDPAYLTRDGLPYKVTFPNFDAGQLPTGGIPAGSLNYFDPQAGRPARTMQWSFLIQRELRRDLVIEVGYVGNRGAWFQSTSAINDNALQMGDLAKLGLDVHNAADRALLTSQIGGPLAAQRGFGNLPYPKFPTTGTVDQALQPYPEYTSILHLWGPLGSTKYDSMQVNLTKRYSHGLDLNANFTWSKQMVNGVESEGVFGSATENDVFNRANNWFLSSNNQPFLLVVSATYTTPKMRGDGMAMKLLSQVTRDWSTATVLRYGSGLPITSPTSTNNLSSLLGSGRSTLYNRVPGQALFTQDINCKCFDPSQTLVLNPAAWQDPGAGNWGTAAARYSDYSGARRPSENISLGRIFRVREKMQLQIRAEFTNMFNRWIWPNPTGTPGTPVQRNSLGQITSGYGFINLVGGGGATVPPPRNGQLVARFTF